MDQQKIGKFIAERRKLKKLTQAQLAERIGVSDRSISKWENGKCMPDLSLFEPLCEELDIKVNELISGEKLATEQYQEKLEETIMQTLDYSKNEIFKEHRKISLGCMIVGILICMVAFTIYETESSWSSIYSLIGLSIFTIGVYRELSGKRAIKRIATTIVIFLGLFGLLYVFDYVGVLMNNRPPIYRYKVETENNNIVYYNLTYTVYRMNANTVNEYYIVDNTKQYTSTNVPISPFNREKSGIAHLKKYKNSYMGNNSNLSQLVESLPLAEYGYVLELDSEQYGVTIDYHTTDWYHNDSNYVQKSLIYNSVSLFALIDNVEYLTYNFSGQSYTIQRSDIEKNYEHYAQITQASTINEDAFNTYVENKMNDDTFVMNTFALLFQT